MHDFYEQYDEYEEITSNIFIAKKIYPVILEDTNGRSLTHKTFYTII